MKKLNIILTSLALVAIVGSVSADRYNRDYIYAQVVDVQPIYENIRVPQNRRVCEQGYRENDRHAPHRKSGGGAILGGIIGGIIGNRFGGGHGREATTALGVIAGASIGANARPVGHYNNNRPRCYTQRSFYEERRLAGYNVSYKYENRIYHTRMRNKPGDRVRIDVNVRLAEY